MRNVDIILFFNWIYSFSRFIVWYISFSFFYHINFCVALCQLTFLAPHFLMRHIFDCLGSPVKQSRKSEFAHFVNPQSIEFDAVCFLSTRGKIPKKLNWYIVSYCFLLREDINSNSLGSTAI